MARLTIPKTSPIVEKFCRDAGVKLRKFKNPEAFEKEIEKFIKQHDIVYLATSKNDAPRCTPLGYRNIGTTLYILSEGGGKFANLKENKKVCYAISSRLQGGQNLMGIRGLQCWGKAEVISMKKDSKRFNETMDMIGITQSLKKRGVTKLPPYHYRIIKIAPLKMRLLNLPEGINNITWNVK
jgi:uncharacterized pyridoxamine 5'-phosphate oxidase family protein